MIKIILGMLLLFLVTACGQPTTSGGNSIDQIIETNFSNDLIILEKQNARCIERKFSEGTTTLPLHLFLDGKHSTLTADFKELLRGTSIRSPKVISRSVYGESIELLYSKNTTRSFVRAKAREINICPEETSWQSGTVESAALNASYFIKKTNAKFRSLVSDVAVAPIALSISPMIIRSVVSKDSSGNSIKKSSYWTDNALYLPNSNMIVYLPESREMKARGFHTRFWEIPMVASHEYGHHLFKSIYGIQGSQNFHQCFNHKEVIEIDTQAGHSFERNIKNEDVLTFINEGFSDLIAHYSLDASEKSLKGVTCLDITRDVDSPVLMNHVKKSFSSDVVAKFFSPFLDLTVGGCHNPSPQEIHVMGAIFAYSANQYLTELTTSNDQKLLGLVEFIKELKSQKIRLQKLTPEESLQEIMRIFFLISAKKLERNIDATLCQKIQEIYPGFEMEECQIIR